MADGLMVRSMPRTNQGTCTRCLGRVRRSRMVSLPAHLPVRREHRTHNRLCPECYEFVLAGLPKTPRQRKAARDQLRKHYDITLEEWEALYILQDGVCAICTRAETRVMDGRVTRLAVDHDHITGAVRGLLCARCNSAIGLLGDDPERVRAAAEYLAQHAATTA